MPRIAAVATAVPEYRVDQNTAKAFARRLFASSRLDLDRLCRYSITRPF